jgi:hypothetical protein
MNDVVTPVWNGIDFKAEAHRDPWSVPLDEIDVSNPCARSRDATSLRSFSRRFNAAYPLFSIRPRSHQYGNICRMHGMRDLSRLRKRPLETDAAASARAADEIDIAGCATIAYSSEAPAHPIEHLLDGRSGPGAARWISARPDTTEHIVVEFDRPQAISRLVYEVERQSAHAPRKYAWKSRRTAVEPTAKFWFRNILSAPGEPPISAKISALISARSAICVSRLFPTRTVPARRRLRRSASSLKHPSLHAAATRTAFHSARAPPALRWKAVRPSIGQAAPGFAHNLVTYLLLLLK